MLLSLIGHPGTIDPAFLSQLEASFEMVSDGVMAFDMSGRVILLNGAQSKLSFHNADKGPHDLRRLNEVSRLSDNDGVVLPMADWPASRVLCGEVVVDLELVVTRIDSGQEWNCSFSGAPLRSDEGVQLLALLITRDLTGSKRAEEDLRLSQENFAHMFANAPYATSIARIPTGVIADVNPAWCTLFGISREEAVGRNSVDLYTHEDPEARVRVMQAFDETGSVRGLETRIVTRSGNHLVLSNNVDPIEIQGKRHALVTLQDVTAQHAATVAIAEGVRLREEFVDIAGHELRTPLATMLIHIHGLQRAGAKGGIPNRLADGLEKAAYAGGRLESLIRQMVDVARISSGKLSMVPAQLDLDELTRNTVEHFRAQAARAGSTLSLVAASGVHGSWDAGRIGQVLGNLILNAIKFGQGNPIEVTVTREGTQVALRVADHGIGIALEDQAKIFERFGRVRVTRDYGGFGLGLWTSRQIMEASGGQIQVSSEPGAGSVFTMILPVRAAEVPHAVG